MKVTGYGAPASVRIRFHVRELDVLVDVLRELRATATQQASDAYVGAAGDSEVDERHERLRTIEGLLMQLDERRPDRAGRVAIDAETILMHGVVRAGAREALRRLQDAHDRYPGYGTAAAREALLDAGETAKAWLVTLTSFDRVDGDLDQ